MSLFNKIKARFPNTANRTVTNRAGGQAYALNPEMELATLLLTSFAQDQFYRSQAQTFDDLKAAMAKVSPEFAAKAAIYARTQFGMRSITHVVAAELAARASGAAWAKVFYDKIVHRPDDMLEISALYMAQNKGKNLPNAMKKGFAVAFNRFDTYQLAKYRGENHAVKLVDLVNLVRPVPTTRNTEGLSALVADTLRNTQTWEAQLTAAGQAAENEAEKAELKNAAWANLLTTNKLGYFALVRNLRNILEQAPEMTDVVVRQLTDEKRIRQSLVLPFRLAVAFKQLTGNDANTRQVRLALERAVDIACQNVPALENTLVVVDNSGSMGGFLATSAMKYSEMGAFFGMVLAKRSNADLMEFGTTARFIPYNLSDSTLAFAQKFEQMNQVGHGTDFHAIFRTAQKRYDRIVIFSDMQGWIGHYAPKSSFDAYKKRTGANPFIYSFDLAGYGTLQFPQSNVFALAGFSEKVFDLMKVLETDRGALIRAIENVEI